MCDGRYNGWSNRETWLIGLWYNPESKADLEYAKESLDEMYEALPPVMKDFVDLGSINWHELEQSLTSEDEE